MVYIQPVKVCASCDSFNPAGPRCWGLSWCVENVTAWHHGSSVGGDLFTEVQEQLTSLERMVEADIIAANQNKSISNSDVLYLSSPQMLGVLCQVSSRYDSQFQREDRNRVSKSNFNHSILDQQHISSFFGWHKSTCPGEEGAGEEAPKRSCRGRRTDLTNVAHHNLFSKVLSSQPWGFSFVLYGTGWYGMSYGFHMVSWYHNILNLFCIVLHFCRCYWCFLVFTASLNRLRTQHKLPMKQCPKSLLMGSVYVATC